MTLLTTATCTSLPETHPDLLATAQAVHRDGTDCNPERHRSFLKGLKAMHMVEMGGDLVGQGSLAGEVRVAAWNLQRCLYPEQSAELLRRYEPDILLASEMDIGMARTHQRHTVRALADSLGMVYAFGVEFLELGPGNALERRLAADDHNQKGWHGNAIFSREDPYALAIIRLDDHGHWFCPPEPFNSENMLMQPRLGGRCAVAAIIPAQAGDICVVSTHLENNASPEMRMAQMERLIAALDSFAPDCPILIGGDLNTNCQPGEAIKDGLDADHGPSEPLFAAASRHGYCWDNNAIGPTTRKGPLTGTPKQPLQQDWFCSRGLVGKGAQIVPAIDASGKILSDHDVIVGQFALS